MDTMPWNFVLLGSIPEAILIVTLGLHLLGKEIPPKRIILIGILQGIASYFIRKYMSFGIHMLCQALTLVILTLIVLRISIRASFFSCLIGLVINALVETPYSLVALKLTGWSIGEIMSRSWLRILYFTPKLMILLGILFLLKRYNFTLEEEISYMKRASN
ncbi:hypothetical protein [Alkaliphilus crotonatoxidans]